MCLLAIAIKQHPYFDLILAANRDEFHARPTSIASFWSDRPNILGGRDLKQDGTWLAVHRDGRFGALTNFRDPSRNKVNAPSRGELIVNFLEGSLSANEYLESLDPARYNDFNLILGDQDRILSFSSVTRQAALLQPGIYALSNHLLDTPWPKVSKARNSLQETIATSNKLVFEKVLETLSDQTQPPDSLLPSTGVGLDWERKLSSIFISGDVYGTRSSTLLTMSKGGRVQLIEQSYGPNAEMLSRVEHEFSKC